MKNLVIFLLLLISNKYYSQQFKLLPDSCTFCFYTTGGVNGGPFYFYNWSIKPNDTITISGNLYTKIQGVNQTYVRQIQNKLLGLFPFFSEERLIMDFDKSIGDTIFNLYSDISSFNYNAIVLNKDSTLLSNGEYHHFIELNAYTEGRQIRWDEKGLCYYNGGILSSIPREDLVHIYNIGYCTTDPLYSSVFEKEQCDSCIANTIPGSGLSEKNIQKINIYPNPSNSSINIHFDDNAQKLIMIRDLIGNEVKKQMTNDNNPIININNLNNGIYFIEITTDDKTFVGTFVKE